MLRFKLVLQDASGRTRTATVEAESQAEAVDLARRKGYHVRNIEPVHDLGDDSEPPAPMETAEVSFPPSPPPPREPARRSTPREPARAAPPRPAAGGSSPLLLASMALSGFAFLIALGTCGYVLFGGVGKTESTENRPDPLGPGLALYDFSTASKAMESEAKIESKLDVRASLQLERKTTSQRAQEKADTLKVHREADFNGAKIVFYSYKEKGEAKYKTQGFEKHEESGFWVKKSIPASDVMTDNPRLADEMKTWEQFGPDKKPADKPAEKPKKPMK